MKKKTTKRLRIIANGLPPMRAKKRRYFFRRGSELIKDGLLQIQGKDVLASQYYKFHEDTSVPVNHFRRLKRAYIKDGEPGLLKYINLINQITQKA